jgi:hypothetical protein
MFNISIVNQVKNESLFRMKFLRVSVNQLFSTQSTFEKIITKIDVQPIDNNHVNRCSEN